MKGNFDRKIPAQPKQEDLKSSPVLVTHFLGIRDKPDIDPALEDFAPIFEDGEYRKHCFLEAKKSFEFIFEKSEFLHQLEQETNEESRLYLRRVRRYGLALRAIY